MRVANFAIKLGDYLASLAPTMTSDTRRPSGATLKRRLSKSLCGVENRPMGSAGLVAKDEGTMWVSTLVAIGERSQSYSVSNEGGS